MIQRVSDISNVTFKSNKRNEDNQNQNFTGKLSSYADSFMRNSVDSAPLLLALTGVWSVIDKKTAKIPFKKALANNITRFFAPVLIFSSLVLAFIENKSNFVNQNK